ncbi:MAG: ATPase [Oscillospiraceae bacterium]|nr:ATPase [Oscillospiraceae bacterium]
MAVSIESMLEALEELLEEGVSVPIVGGGKRFVDVEQARDIIDDIRINMPQEILQAKAIVQDKAQIIAKANKEAEEIVRKAEERARRLVDEQEIVAKATEKANEITQTAQSQATQLKTTVTEYCDNILTQTQEQLKKSFDEVKLVKENLKK